MTNISRSTSTAVRLIAVILLLAAVVAGVWLQRAPLLRGAANLWIVSDRVTQSDVVAVLGGDFEGRPFVAAELYKKGLVSKVLVSQVAETRPSEIGAIIPGDSELNRRVLLTLGVPDAAIGMFGQANRNTGLGRSAWRFVDRHPDRNICRSPGAMDFQS